MADITVSQLTPIVKENNGIRFLSINGAPAVLSTEVAQHFQRRHQHILRDIDRIMSMCPKSFTATNFGRSDYQDSTGRAVRAFLLTRDALSLLIMGMTGKAAIMWKLRYIEAFNALESAVRENAREAGYLAGRAEALSPPALEAERKKGYLAGLAEGKRLAKREDRLAALEKMIAHRIMHLPAISA